MEKGRHTRQTAPLVGAALSLVQVILSGVEPQVAAAICGVSRATAYRLLRRYSEGGWEALRDRPPIAKHYPHRLSAEAEAQIVELRRRTGWGHARCRRRLAGPPRRSGGCLSGMAAHASSASPNRQRIGMSTPRPVNWCTWTSRSWAASGTSVNASWAMAYGEALELAGSTPTSPSMITRGWHRSSCEHPNRPSTVSPSPTP